MKTKRVPFDLERTKAGAKIDNEAEDHTLVADIRIMKYADGDVTLRMEIYGHVFEDMIVLSEKQQEYVRNILNQAMDLEL